MASFNVSYIVDDQDESITYLCPVNQQSVIGPYFNSTWTTIADASCGQGWFQYKFYGTAISVSAPMTRYGQQATVQIDDNEALRPYGRGIWYSSDLSDDEEHTLTWSVGDEGLFPAFDYLTVTAGSSTSLDGRTIILDDSQHGTRGPLSFSGSWTIAPPTSLVFDYSNVPFWDTTHWTNQVGDTMSLQFMGTSITVYGVLTNTTTAGNITTTYTLDGESTDLPLPGAISNKTSPMVALFHADLKPGNHSLVLNVSQVASSDTYLGIDFVAFNSSVDNVASLGWDNFGIEPSTSGAIEGNSVDIHAIIGGVVGGLVALFLAICGILLLRRRKQRAPKQQRQFPPIVLTRLHDDDADSFSESKPRVFGRDNDLEAPLPVLTKH